MPTDNPPYAWGDNAEGALGINVGGSRSSPVLVAGGHSFTQVAAAMFTSIGLKSDGSAWTWGNGADGGLGDNTVTDKSSPVAVVGGHSFTAVTIGGTNATGNPASAYGLKANGEVWAWGNNAAFGGQLGDGTSTSRSSPVLVIGGHSFVEIQATLGTLSSGFASVVARKADGSAWCWGYNAVGQLGDGTIFYQFEPVAVVDDTAHGPATHSFVQVACGVNSAYGLKADGSVWGWGQNANGQLANLPSTTRSSPVLIDGGHSFTSIAGGGFMAMGLKANGEVWTWGNNAFGGLGDNTTTAKAAPVLVVGGHSFTAIARGYLYCLALKENGELWGWGQNTSGQLGQNTLTNRSSPVLVVGGFQWAAMSGGDTHSLAIPASVVLPYFPFAVSSPLPRFPGNADGGAQMDITWFMGPGWGRLVSGERNRLVRG